MRIANTRTNSTTTNPTVVARESSEFSPPVPPGSSVSGVCPSGVFCGTVASERKREVRGEVGGNREKVTLIEKSLSYHKLALPAL